MKTNDSSYLNRHALFLIALADALLEAGCSTHRLEDKIENICRAKGLESEVLIVPTGIHLQLKHHSSIITRFIRVKKLGIKMNRLHDLSDFCDQIIYRGLGTRLAKKQLEKILIKEDPYPQSVVIICFSIVSMFFQFILGGGILNCLFCAFLGVIVYFSEGFFSRTERTSFLSNFISAFLVTTLCIIFQILTINKDIELLILSGLIILVPGLGLTNAIAELSHRQFVSGSSRLIEALLILCFISFGVYLPLHLFGAQF